MCFHIGNWWQVHRWCTLTLEADTKNKTHHQLIPSKNENWSIVMYLPICSRHSMFYHSRNLPPSSPLFKQFSALGSKGDILIELNLFNAFRSHFFLDSFIANLQTKEMWNASIIIYILMLWYETDNSPTYVILHRAFWKK